MPANPTAATVVGNKFVFEYYTTLSQKPENIATFYKAESTLTSGGASFEMNATSDAETSVFVGAANIEKKILASNFKGANVVLSSISCQESLNGGVLVSVLGTIQTKTDSGMEPARAFVHVFFLGVQTEPIYSYFVLNDIFTFVNTSVSPSPKSAHIPYPSAPAFSVSSAPKEAVHHSPIPAPQHTPAPVSVEAPKPTPQPIPEPVKHPKQQAPAQQPAPTPAPAKTEAPVVATTSSGEKQKNPKDKKSTPRASQQPQTNNGEFYVKGDKKNKDNKSPRTQHKKKDQQPQENQQQPPKQEGTEQPQHQHQPKQEQQEKKPIKKQNSNGNRKNEKKAENQDKSPVQTQSNGTANNAVPVKNNSWAAVVAVADQPIFAPPAVVYVEPPKAVVEEAPKVEKKREEKPKKQKEPKKETPEEQAMKKTRELRSIRVSNLPFEVELAAVQTLFKQFGEVKEVVLKRGFAYIEFHTVTGVTNVLTHVRKNDLTIEDPKGKPRALNVEQRKPKVEVESDKPFYMTEKIAFEAKKKQDQPPATTTAVPSS